MSLQPPAPVNPGTNIPMPPLPFIPPQTGAPFSMPGNPPFPPTSMMPFQPMFPPLAPVQAQPQPVISKPIGPVTLLERLPSLFYRHNVLLTTLSIQLP